MPNFLARARHGNVGLYFTRNDKINKKSKDNTVTSSSSVAQQLALNRIKGYRTCFQPRRGVAEIKRSCATKTLTTGKLLYFRQPRESRTFCRTVGHRDSKNFETIATHSTHPLGGIQNRIFVEISPLCLSLESDRIDLERFARIALRVLRYTDRCIRLNGNCQDSTSTLPLTVISAEKPRSVLARVTSGTEIMGETNERAVHLISL